MDRIVFTRADKVRRVNDIQPCVIHVRVGDPSVGRPWPDMNARPVAAGRRYMQVVPNVHLQYSSSAVLDLVLPSGHIWQNKWESRRAVSTKQGLRCGRGCQGS